MNSSKKLCKLVMTGAFAAAMSFTFSSALYTGVTTASTLNLRSEPGGEAIGSVPLGTKVAVIDGSDEWYEIAVDGKTAFVSNAYIKRVPDSDFRLGYGVVTCETTVNLRSGPSTETKILDSLPNGAKIEAIGIADGWYKVKTASQTGYISADYFIIAGSSNEALEAARFDDPEAGGDLRASVIDFAERYLGTPYVYGGSSPSGFDCSGFTSYVYKNTVGPIARTSSDQRNTTVNISKSELLPGDLVFFGSGDNVNHVGIFVGDGQFIHSPNSGSVVRYDSLDSGNYSRRFICGGRVIGA